MSKSKVAMRNVATAKKTVKKPAVKADSKVIKKAKSDPVKEVKSSKSAKAVAAKSSSGQSKKVAPESQPKKAALSKKVVESKENKVPAKEKSSSVKQKKEVEPQQVIQSIMPKKPMSGYFQFVNQRREQFIKENPKLSLTEATKALAQEWNAMDDKQKLKYNKLVEDDKKRYQKEMDDINKKGFFITKDGENSRELYLQKQRKLSQVQPKKPLSAYMYYVLDASKELKSQNPEIKITEITKQAGAQWNKLTEDQKKKYNDLNKKDIKRHELELKQLETKGYFINADGVKSTDMVKPKFKYPEGTIMPKPAVTAYKFYVQENCQKIQEKQNISQSEALTICQKVWEKLSDKQTQKFQTLHEQDVIRREKQIIQLQQNGFFIKEDGTKSIDAVAKSKK